MRLAWLARRGAPRRRAAGTILALVALPAAGQPPPGDFIAEYARKHDFNGTILIREREATVYTRSFGLANFEHRVANSPQTRYKIASITKLFTSALVMQMVDEGRLDLDATIATYLPEYRGAGAQRVNLRQLLNHTSGIANFDRVKSAEEAIRDGIPNYQLPHTSDALLAEFCSGALESTPGERFSYNNADYIILGKILEKVAGESFDRLLEKRILLPLGLGSTGMLRQSDIVLDLADTYFHRGDLGRLVPDLPAYPENWFAAGAMYSTAQDLAAFADALFGAKLVSGGSLEKMTQPGLDDYGFGLWSHQVSSGGRQHRIVKRPGQIMGAQSQLYRLVDERITIVILANTGTTDLDDFVAGIGQRMME